MTGLVETSLHPCSIKPSQNGVSSLIIKEFVTVGANSFKGLLHYVTCHTQSILGEKSIKIYKKMEIFFIIIF